MQRHHHKGKMKLIVLVPIQPFAVIVLWVLLLQVLTVVIFPQRRMKKNSNWHCAEIRDIGCCSKQCMCVVKACFLFLAQNLDCGSVFSPRVWNWDWGAEGSKHACLTGGPSRAGLEAGVEVHYSVEFDNDDTLAFFAQADGADVLSQDSDLPGGLIVDCFGGLMVSRPFESSSSAFCRIRNFPKRCNVFLRLCHSQKCFSIIPHISYPFLIFFECICIYWGTIFCQYFT